MSLLSHSCLELDDFFIRAYSEQLSSRQIACQGDLFLKMHTPLVENVPDSQNDHIFSLVKPLN